MTTTDPAMIRQCEGRILEIIKMLIDPDLEHFKTRVNQIYSDLQANHES